jgi:TonB family protein
LWDEGVPIGVEVNNTIIDFTKQRTEADHVKAGEFRLTPCAVSTSRTVRISAGVAATLLKTRIDSVNPDTVIGNHVAGTVVLSASIDTVGRVKSLKVVSGPASLQKAALDAARHWTYRPYLLNNRPVEVETTINVVFGASRQPRTMV